jgi:hypothetical protein
MPSGAAADVLNELPYAMRDSISGYVDAVEAALPDIARDAAVKLTHRVREDFLLIVAIRRIWEAVNGQYWIINNCAEIANDRGLAGFQAGSEIYNKQSGAYDDVRGLRQQFSKLLDNNDIREIVEVGTLRDALVAVAGHD